MHHAYKSCHSKSVRTCTFGARYHYGFPGKDVELVGKKPGKVDECLPALSEKKLPRTADFISLHATRDSRECKAYTLGKDGPCSGDEIKGVQLIGTTFNVPLRRDEKIGGFKCR